MTTRRSPRAARWLDAGAPARLSTDDFNHLRALGELARIAPTKADRLRLRGAAVEAAQERYLLGVTWEALARALGIPSRTLRSWRASQQPPKEPAQPAPPDPRPAPLPTGPQVIPPAGTLQASATTLITINDSASINLLISRSATNPGFRAVIERPMAAANQPFVGVGTGHPDSARYRFDAETAAIQEPLLGLAHVQVLPAMTLVQITRFLDDFRPLLFHLAAHADNEGVHLCTGADRRLRVERSDAVGQPILNACARPNLVVLNYCRSLALGRELMAAIPFVIGWPGSAEDQQFCSFTETLYESLRFDTIRTAYDDALRELASPHPDLDGPQLLCASARDTTLFRAPEGGS